MESGYYAIVIKSSVLTKSGKEVVEKIPLESPDVDIKKPYEWSDPDAYGMPEVIADDAMRIIRYWQRH